MSETDGREGPAASIPTGTVTFLFTDIEGSSRLWEDQPDEMGRALVAHDEVLRAAVEGHGGRLVKSTGDGAFAAFADADDAIASAYEAQTALIAHPWTGIGALRARMAVHTGVADERDGDYFGNAVNRAARLMAIGHGGQVLVSQATAGLLRGAQGLRDLGEHRLRDLAQPERVYQLVAEGLPDDFPSASVPRGTADQPAGGAHRLRGPGARRPHRGPTPPRAPGGDAHGGRWGRQDPARHAGGRRGHRPLPRRRVARRVGGRGRGARRGGPGGGAGRRGAARRERRIGPAGHVALETSAPRARQLRAPARGGATDHGGLSARGARGDDLGDEQGRSEGPRRAARDGAVARRGGVARALRPPCHRRRRVAGARRRRSGRDGPGVRPAGRHPTRHRAGSRAACGCSRSTSSTIA